MAQMMSALVRLKQHIPFVLPELRFAARARKPYISTSADTVPRRLDRPGRASSVEFQDTE